MNIQDVLIKNESPTLLRYDTDRIQNDASDLRRLLVANLVFVFRLHITDSTHL
jgi:hypothetical protein